MHIVEALLLYTTTNGAMTLGVLRRTLNAICVTGFLISRCLVAIAMGAKHDTLGM